MSNTDYEDPEKSGITHDDLSKLFAFVMHVAGLPLAALGIVNLIAIHYHIALLPLGQDIIENYRLATHLILGGLYWIPFHFLHLAVPVWLKDLATISIVSSAVSWRALAGRDHPLTDWNVSFRQMYFWAVAPVGVVSVYDMISHVVQVLPMFVTHSLAWMSGSIVYFLTRTRWIAGFCAATVRVTVRGMFLIGLLIMVDMFLAIVAPVADEETARDRRKDAAKYFLYVGVVIIAVIFFFGRLGAELPVSG